jgi:hypothetical protein
VSVAAEYFRAREVASWGGYRNWSGIVGYARLNARVAVGVTIRGVGGAR